MRASEFINEAFSQAAADRNKLKYQKQGRIGHGVGWKPMSDSPHEIVNNIVHQFDNISRMVAYDSASDRVKHSMVDRFMRKYGYPLELFPDVISGIEAKLELNEGKEQFNYELTQKGFHFEQEINGVTYRVSNKKGGSDNINIEALDDKGQSIGFARFWMHQYKDGLESLSTQVRDDWQGKGIAANMYAVMRMLGVNIHPASTQSDDGKKMWNKWNQQGDAQHIKSMNAKMQENFADGKHPEDKGDSKRYHVPTKASVSTLRKVAHQGGRKGQLAHWMANMKAGRAKHAGK